VSDLHERYEGRWWIPGKQSADGVSGGSLDLGGDFGGVLRLNGSLQWDLSRRAEQTYDIPVIHGESAEGDRLTLLDAFVTGTRSRLGGTATSQELVVQEVLVGEHLDAQSLVFDSIEFELTALAEWLGGPRVVVEESQTTDAFVVTYKRSTPAATTVNPIGEVVLVRGPEYKSTPGTFTLRDSVRFLVKLETPRSIEEVFDLAVAPLQNLVTFATLTPSLPSRVTATSPGVLVTPNLEVQLPIAVYRRGVERADLAERRVAGSYERLFTLGGAPVGFGDLVRRWFDLSSRLGPLIDLYLSLDYSPSAHVETSFINVCQAAEGYHRATLTESVMKQEEHRGLVEILLQSVPPGRREWLSGVLAHSNEPSFRRRVNALADRAGDAIRPLVATRPRYSAKMRDHRNDFAHWLISEPIQPETAIELDDLVRVTRFVLASNLMIDLGWSVPDIAQAFNQNWQYAALVQRGRRAAGSPT